MSIRLETAADNHKVPVIEYDGRVMHLGSMYDGREAASIWCDVNLIEKKENLILFGLGDGQIALEAAQRLKGYVYVYEPDKEILDRMKSSRIYKKLRSEQRVRISGDITDTDRWMILLKPFFCMCIRDIESALGMMRFLRYRKSSGRRWRT